MLLLGSDVVSWRGQWSVEGLLLGDVWLVVQWKGSILLVGAHLRAWIMGWMVVVHAWQVAFG